MLAICIRTTHILAYECEEMFHPRDRYYVYHPSKTFLFFQFGLGWNSLFWFFIFMSVHSVDCPFSRYAYESV